MLEMLPLDYYARAPLPLPLNEECGYVRFYSFYVSYDISCIPPRAYAGSLFVPHDELVGSLFLGPFLKAFSSRFMVDPTACELVLHSHVLGPGVFCCFYPGTFNNLILVVGDEEVF